MAENKINFTKETINSLPLPEKGYTQYRDEKTPGLILRVYPTGVKTFYIHKRIGGKPEYMTLSPSPGTPARYPDITPEQARKLAKVLIGMIASGKNPAEENRNIKAEMTLGELFERYLTLHAKRHKRTWKYDESMFRLYFSVWAGRRISTITRREVQTLHGRMGEENGESQANRAFALLHTIFEKGREWGYAGDNPCFKLKKFQEQSRERFLQKDELPRFFQAVMAEPNEMDRDFLLMLLYTGARKSNVLGMAWKDISLDQKLWNIPAAQSKNKTSYTIPVVTPAMEILVRRKKDNPNSLWVFPSISKSGHLQEPKKVWKRVLETSGLEDVRMHDLRRTLGSWMARTGSSLLTIAYALGHKLSSLSVTAVYARASIEHIRVEMETAVQAMLQAGEMNDDEEHVVEFRTNV